MQDVGQFLQVGRGICPGARLQVYNILMPRFCEVKMYQPPHRSVVRYCRDGDRGHFSLHSCPVRTLVHLGGKGAYF